jgi:hypothetical protein
MIDSLFYYPMTLHRGTISASVLAPFVKNLPSVSGVVEEIYVRTQDANPAGQPSSNAYTSQASGVQGGQGVYVWDAIDTRFRFVMPYSVICEGVVAGSYVDIYYALTGTGSAIPTGSTVYRNGAIYTGTTFTTNDKAVWAVLTSPAVVAGSVKTVQGIGPDSNGNITLPFASETVAGLIRIGANLTIDSNGVLSAEASSSYVLPAATASTLGGVIVGPGLGVSPTGILNADVVSVNGLQGAVVLAANNITTGTFGAAQLGTTPGDNEVLITNAAGIPTWVSTLPTSNLPSSILGAVEYQGTFVPGTSTLPAAASGNKGWYYVASAAGTYTPPGGSLLTFSAGDWIISNGSEWDTVNNGGAVTSVNGQTGAVTIQAVDNNDASGTTIISDSGSSTGVIKLKTLVAGSGVTIVADANGNLVFASSAVTSFNGRSGAVALELSDVTGVGGAPIASPGFTGIPTAPTASAGTDNTQIATTAFVMSAVESGVAGVSSFNTRTGAVTLELGDVTGVGGAPLASPALTGQPTAPTPTIGDSSTNIATTAFVESAIASGNAGMIVRYDYDATPGQTSFPVTFAENSLVEVFRNGGLLLQTDYNKGTTGPVVLNIPANEGDDVIITVQQQYAAENTMPITGGTFTGSVYGPTPTAGDDSTALATTAFVQEAITSGAGVTSFNTRSGAVSLEGADISGAGGALVGSANTFTAANSFTGGSITVPTQTAGTNNTTAASTAFVATALGTYAPLASPSLTGVPAAPTAAPGTDTTQIATTAFVQAAVTAGEAGVSSFNTRTGAVTLEASDVSGVGGALVGSANTFTGANSFTGGSITVPTATAGTNTTAAASTAYVVNALGTYAPLASPSLTGVPVAPTAAVGTSTTQIATTAFVATSFAPLASPALTGTPTSTTPTAGDNTTKIATTAYVVNALGTYAPLASPSFTGVPLAPTAAVGTDTTQIASTAFVYGATQGASAVALTNANVTLSAAQYSVPVVVFTGTLTGNVVVTVPTTGQWDFLNTTTGAFTITVSNGTGATQVVAQSTTAFTPLVSNATEGVVAIAATASGVTSFNTRTGAVTPASGDYTVAQVTGAAPLASPALTGTPTAPTPTAGNSSTDIATTAFVATSFAPLANPSLTGVPVAPTASVGTNTTQLATTAFVYAAAQGASSIALTNANVTLSAAQYSVPVIVLTGTLTGNVVLTVPTNGQWDFLNTTTGAFTVTVSNGTGTTQVVAQSTTTFTPLVSNATEGVMALPASSGGVTSFNTRTGAVVPASGDYTVAQVTGAAPLASPSLTGVPVAPTAAVGTNTTQLATTAFVYGASQGASSVALTNANVTLSAAQYSVPIVVLTGTLTASLNVTFPTTGSWQIYNATTGTFTVTATNGTGATLALPQGVVTEIVSNSTAGILSSQPTTVTGRFQVGAESYTVTALGSVSGTQTLNLTTASEWTMTITGATTIAFSNAPASPNSQVVYIRFTNAGSAAITWPTGTQFPGGTAPTFTTSGIDLIGVKYDTTSSSYFVFVIGLNMVT